MDDHRRLAALAVFRELYDNQKNLYDILREFIIEIIVSRRLYSFSAASMITALEENFGIRVPEAVVKSVLNLLPKKNDWCVRQEGEYTISNVPEGIASDIKQKYTHRQDINEGILKRLVKYINGRRKKPLNVHEEKTAINSFCAFLLNEKNGEEYSKYISSFVLDHEDDNQFQSDLNEIREGIILYSGITYNDKPSEVGSWTNEMTLFLDQEILFHCYGLNGKLFKSYFNDFHRFVKEINANGRKKLIHLRYLPETKDEIDSFFSYAEMVVRNQKPMRPGNSAMKSIVNGCDSASDVKGKKTKFYLFLNEVGISLEDRFVFDELKYPHNILSEDVYRSVLWDLWQLEPQNIELQRLEPQTKELQDKEYRETKIREKVYRSLTILNKIHCLRGDAHSKNFYEVKCHFLTGTDVTLKTAWHEDIKGSETVPLATSLDWVTNKFWFKLNKGFEGDNFPSSSQVLAKARVVLSSMVNRNVGEQYDKLLIQHKNGELSKDLVQFGIIDLMQQTVNPEEINTQNIGLTLDFLQRDSLEYYKAEQEADTLRQKEQDGENERLQGKIEQMEQEAKKLKAKLQRQEDIRELERLTRELTIQDSIKTKADTWCSVLCRVSFVALVFLTISVAGGVYIYFTTHDWNLLEPLVAAGQIVVSLVFFVILVVFRKPLKPKNIRAWLETSIRKNSYATHGVCEDRLCELRGQVERLKEELG